MNGLLKFLPELISGMLPFVLTVFGGLYITLKGRFFQFTGLVRSLGLVKRAFRAPKEGKEVTSFGAACTALSATVGTGNIAGVAGALSLGGAGAVFWMWVSAFAGMAVKYGEVALAVLYREKNGKAYRGGPMYYIKRGMPKLLAPLSTAFALAAIPAVICSGNITQTNAAVLSVSDSLYIRLAVGAVFAALTSAAASGGIGRIGRVTERVVPLMAVAYVMLCLGAMTANIKLLPMAILQIFKGVFSPRAVTGGAVGSAVTAMLTGAERGIFSNEAGLGTSAMAHSAAADAEADTQGLFGIFEVFVDTVLLCTLTALTILCSGVKIPYGSVASAELVGEALSISYGGFSSVMLSGMMCIFALSSVIGWATYGNICFSYLFGDGGLKLFNLIYPLGCIAGALCNARLAWELSAFFNGIMLCINLPAVIFMSDRFLNKKRN